MRPDEEPAEVESQRPTRRVGALQARSQSLDERLAQSRVEQIHVAAQHGGAAPFNDLGGRAHRMMKRMVVAIDTIETDLGEYPIVNLGRGDRGRGRFDTGKRGAPRFLVR